MLMWLDVAGHEEDAVKGPRFAGLLGDGQMAQMDGVKAATEHADAAALLCVRVVHTGNIA